MPDRLIKCLIAVLLCASILHPARSAAGPTTARSPGEEVVYKPPKRGAPAARVGGGSRGSTDDLPTLAVLVPPETAYTTTAQPALFWFIARPTTTRCEISMTDMSTLETVFDKTLDTGVATAGIQTLDLAAEHVTLKPGVQYQWLVALVPDPAAPSKNVDAGGFITHVPMSPELAEKLRGATRVQKAAVLADAGIWFDALSELAEAIKENPGDASIRQKRAGVLQQVGLKEAAAFDAK